jgi:hypothetical protein
MNATAWTSRAAAGLVAGDAGDASPTPVPAGAPWTDTAFTQITDNRALFYLALAASIATLAFLYAKARRIAKSDKPDDAMSTIGMLIGLGWSGEAMWIIGTELLDIPIPLLALLLFVLEINLATAMIRAKRHHRLHGHPGSYGTTAWTIAAAMAVIAAAASQSLAEAALRIAIPLLVTKTWWDGMVGSGAKKLTGAITWRWTPRRLLLWLGAIEPGEKDVETVNRERLTQQMTRLEFRRQYGRDSTRKRVTARLARLSLSADDAVIEEVRQRVARASWFTAMPLATRPVAHGDAAGGAPLNPPVARPATQAAKRVEMAPTRRGKVVTQPLASGDAAGADPATQAAQLYLTGAADSIREAARKVPGASEATVRRRINEARDAVSDASPDAPDLPIPDPREPVLAGVNGHHHTTEEN